MIRLWAFFCSAVGTLLVGLLLLAVLIPPLRQLPASLLVKDDLPKPGADAILLLMGDAEDRAPHAAELLKDGHGKVIVLVETESDRLIEAGVKKREGQMVYDYLTQALQVPKDSIIFEKDTQVSSTFEEAKELLKVAESKGFQRSLLVTSWYHSSRASWIFHRSMITGVGYRGSIESAPSTTPQNWLEREKDFLNVYNEYLKWIYYYVKYEVLA